MYSQNFYYLNVFENAFLFFKHNLKRIYNCDYLTFWEYTEYKLEDNMKDLIERLNKGEALTDSDKEALKNEIIKFKG